MSFEVDKVINKIYHIDMFFEPNVVLEINGFMHYINGRRTGIYELKYRNLVALQYKVHELPLNKWKNLSHNHRDRHEYFHSLLK